MIEVMLGMMGYDTLWPEFLGGKKYLFAFNGCQVSIA